MKTILALLILTCAPALDAQERVLLQMDTTTFGPVTNWQGGSDGENNSGVKQVGQRPGLAYMMWHLPLGDKPDSLEFVFRSNTIVQLWTLNATANNYCRISCEEPSEAFIRVTVPYEECKRDKVYAATGLADCGLRTPDSTGFVEVDAVYAVWAAPVDSTKLAVDPAQTLIEIQQVYWYGAESIHNPKPLFHGTLKELKASGLHGLFFSILGKHADLP